MNAVQEPRETAYERILREAEEAAAARKSAVHTRRAFADTGAGRSTVEDGAFLQGYTGLRISGISSEGVYFRPVNDPALKAQYDTRFDAGKRRQVIAFSRMLRRRARYFQGEVLADETPDLHKTCAQCKLELPNTAFYFYPDRSKRSRHNPQGLRSICKRCHNENRQALRVRIRD